MKRLSTLALLVCFVGCSTSSYKRTPSLVGGEDTIEFHSRNLFVNSKILKFSLDSKTDKTRRGLTFGASENEVATAGIEAVFQGMSSLVGAAVAAGVKGSMGIPTLPRAAIVRPPRTPASTNETVTIPGLTVDSD